MSKGGNTSSKLAAKESLDIKRAKEVMNSVIGAMGRDVVLTVSQTEFMSAILTIRNIALEPTASNDQKSEVLGILFEAIRKANEVKVGVKFTYDFLERARVISLKAENTISFATTEIVETLIGVIKDNVSPGGNNALALSALDTISNIVGKSTKVDCWNSEMLDFLLSAVHEIIIAVEINDKAKKSITYDLLEIIRIISLNAEDISFLATEKMTKTLIGVIKADTKPGVEFSKVTHSALWAISNIVEKFTDADSQVSKSMLDSLIKMITVDKERLNPFYAAIIVEKIATASKDISILVTKDMYNALCKAITIKSDDPFSEHTSSFALVAAQMIADKTRGTANSWWPSRDEWESLSGKIAVRQHRVFKHGIKVVECEGSKDLLVGGLEKLMTSKPSQNVFNISDDRAVENIAKLRKIVFPAKIEELTILADDEAILSELSKAIKFLSKRKIVIEKLNINGLESLSCESLLESINKYDGEINEINLNLMDDGNDCSKISKDTAAFIVEHTTADNRSDELKKLLAESALSNSPAPEGGSTNLTKGQVNAI